MQQARRRSTANLQPGGTPTAKTRFVGAEPVALVTRGRSRTPLYVTAGMVMSAEKALTDTKEQIKALRRQARQATTLEEQHAIQQKIQKLERQQRRQRQEIFQVEDEIMDQRDSLIESLERRLAQRTESATLFTVRWEVK
jgi:predicted RNase H-like nuclease (RuvC/YqgF family)